MVWQPLSGNGIRPSSVLAINVTSFATADIEMTAVAAANPRLRTGRAVHHFVFSFNEAETATLSDEIVIAASKKVVDRIGLGEHQAVFSVHRDTNNLHVHAAVGSVNPFTLRVWDTYRNKYALAWAAREVELELGLAHDKGAAVVRHNGMVQWTDAPEKRAFRRSAARERLDDEARRFASDYEGFDTPESWVHQVVAVKLNECVDRLGQASIPTTWSALHATAAAFGARLHRTDLNSITFELYQRAPQPDEAQKGEDEEFDRRYDRGKSTGVRVTLPIDEFLRAESESEVERRRALFSTWLDEEASEAEWIGLVERDPGMISRQLVNADGLGVFSRGDIDRVIATHVSNFEDVSRLSQYVEAQDATLIMLSPDTEQPLFTTAPVEEISRRVRRNAMLLASRRNERFNADVMERVIAEIEAERSTPSFQWQLSQEQRQVLYGAAFGLSCTQGDAGTGKTTIMAALQRYAQGTGIKIAGLTLSEAAAKKLEREAGITSVNSARGLFAESQIEELGRYVPRNGIVVVDESSMMSYSAMDGILALANQRDTTVITIGDKAQLQNIEFGSPNDVITQVAQETGRFTTLTTVLRQEAQWHRDVVRILGKAIRDRDSLEVEKQMLVLAQHGVIELLDDRSAVIEAAAEWYVSKTTQMSQSDVLLLAGDKITMRHVNDRVRNILGLAGKGTTFPVSRGVRELCAGDRIGFLKNEARLNVYNNDVGTVLSVTLDSAKKYWTVTVRLDRGPVVSFNPRRHRSWDHAYAVTTHKAQGANVLASAAVIDQSVTAELFHVQHTRARRITRIFAPKTNFPTVDDLAERVADRIQGKDDALLYQEAVDRFGGPDSEWAKRVRKAAQDITDPLRVAHAKDMRQRSEEYKRAVKPLHEERRRIRRAESGPQARDADRRYKLQVKELAKKLAPETFMQWVVRNGRWIEYEQQRASSAHAWRQAKQWQQAQEEHAPRQDGQPQWGAL